MGLAGDNYRGLGLFLLLSVSLHAALLYALHLPLARPGATANYPLAVRLAAPPSQAHPAANPHRRPSAMVGEGEGAFADASSQRKSSPAPTLAESSLNIAQAEARTSEQARAASEKYRSNTPAGLLEQYMRMPHKEILFANGMRKIVTDHGAICFQPVPHFARDQAGLFGIPVTCP